jgi:L-fuconolactonase
VTTVDAHHHFWDPAKADYPWLTEALAPIRRAFGPADLEPLLTESRIDATVLVQTRSSVDETRDFLALAARHAFIAGVVGWVDLTAPSVADDIATLRAAPGGDRLVAIRHQVQDEPDAAWLSRADVRRGLHAVEAAGLAYDLLIRTRELHAATDAAAALPNLRFVLDHAAKPPIESHEMEPWGARLARLAALDNVTCKLSGLVTEASWTSWSSADLRPYVENVLERFGPERVMFGSDWPVCLLAATYGRVVETAKDLTSELTTAERTRILGATALETYRLRAS